MPQTVDNIFPDESPHPILSISADNRLLYSNPAGVDLLASLVDTSDLEAPQDWQPIIHQALRSGESAEIECYKGQQLFVCLFVPVAAANCVNIYGLELTRRVQAQETEQESVRQLKLAYQQMMIYAQELRGEFTERKRTETLLRFNKQFAQVFAQQLEVLELLHDVGLRLMDNLDTDAVLSLISQAVLDLIPEATGCVMHFLSDRGQELLSVVFSPEANSKIVYPGVGIEDIVRQAIERGELSYVPDLLADPRYTQTGLPNMRALLVIPLTDNQQLIGTLSVYSLEPGVFEEEQHYILKVLANQAAVAIMKARFFQERERIKEHEKWAIRDLFQRYVGPTVVERLVSDMQNLTLGGKRQEITVLFADLRGFTQFSENLPPERLVEVLNQYLALVVEAIFAQEGTVDKFIGDAVMSVFNAPLPQPDHTLRAVRAALAIQRAMADYHTRAAHDSRLSFGIGIHVGQAVVGNIGTVQQMNYTAIGDTVNLAWRLQENARGGQIMLSQAAYEAVKHQVIVEDLGPLLVKGRSAQVHTYALIDLT